MLWISTTLYLAAGFSVYIFILNRVLIRQRNGFRKTSTILGAFFLIVPGSALLGCLQGIDSWAYVPAALLVVTAIWEMHRLYLRRRHKASIPVEMMNGKFAWGRPFTTMDLAVLRYEVVCPDWKGPDLRIAHMSDFHVSDRLPLSYFESAILRVGELEADLVFLTGDFVTKTKYAHLLPGLVSKVRGKAGTFAILGNHDFWEDPDVIAKALGDGGVDLMQNSCRRLEFGNGQSILVSGCEDPWRKPGWQAPAREDSEPLLIMTHTPDNIYRLSRSGALAVFAGHSHAGQGRIPGVGALAIPSIYGRRFDFGHFEVNGTHLFITAGIGAAVVPLRIWCPPDIFCVDLKGRKG